MYYLLSIHNNTHLKYDIVAFVNAHTGNTGAHKSCAEHAHVFGLQFRRAKSILFAHSVAVEYIDQRLGLISDTQLGEAFGLGLVACFATFLQARLDHLNDLERGRVEALCLS